ncbi:amidase [Sporolactobacillus kofuensis]|uniref:Amidase n=1 Tax=Sporolactobacillus kofuensis TaxID=269672 RepID=A0ABW1WGM4_9BACL|nr:amidase [Sporolactobacillus kofuensis]MCO7175814.1 amidase [Sporolactobacillus kofuensis]
MINHNDYGAFINPSMTLSLNTSGPLSGLKFALKDVFAVKGYKNSAGNPTWLTYADEATEHADVVNQLLHHGATLVGTTVTDELMYSLKGDNKHYPPTINPKAPDSFTGGSSSGSAVSVASHQTDFSIGTDTGGSVRIPSSYCGLFGMRPSHGLISMNGVIPLAPSFDTVGWMANHADILAKVGDVLLPDQTVHAYKTIYVFQKAFDLLQDSDDIAYYHKLLQLLNDRYTLKSVDLLDNHSFHELTECFRILQGKEAWQSHGQWINQYHPDFSKDISGRFEMASKIKEDVHYHLMLQTKQNFTTEMHQLLGSDSLVIIPTTVGSAPSRESSFSSIESLRAQTMKLTCLAGLSGLPQITRPLLHTKKPLGLSFISGYNTDKQLLQFVRNVDLSGLKGI